MIARRPGALLAASIAAGLGAAAGATRVLPTAGVMPNEARASRIANDEGKDARASDRGDKQPTRPRNVVIILSDDHRYDFMSFTRRAPAFLQTPSLDRMAAITRLGSRPSRVPA